MRRACLRIRAQPHYRAEAFVAGAAAAGFTIVQSIPDPTPLDLLVIWNRYGSGATEASMFESRRASVLVVENGYVGTDENGVQRYSIQRSQLHGYGEWAEGGGERLDELGIEFTPWRFDGTEVVITAQRGIGLPPVAATAASADRLAAFIAPLVKPLRVRVRHHPTDRGPKAPTLLDDLSEAAFAVCHTSAAGLHALIAGIPVVTTAQRWIGLPAAVFAAPDDRSAWLKVQQRLRRDDALRRMTFERVAWAQWTVSEIASGEPFRRLCM